MVREVELLAEMTVTLLTDRRVQGPYGLAGGADGAPGRNVIVEDGAERTLPSKGSFALQSGSRLRLETPGGGGFGE